MTAHRLRSSLALALLAVALAGRTPAWFDAPAAATPAPPAIAFDSLAVDFPHFSPNADGQKDIVTFNYRLTDTTVAILVYVHPVASPDTTIVLQRISRQDPQRNVRVQWTGIDRDGHPAPDGDYLVEFSGTALSTGLPLHNQRTVTVDRVAPQVQILDVTPAVFAPHVRGASPNVQVRVRVTQAVFGDTLQLFFQKTGRRVPLPLVTAFVGNGDYKAVTDTAFANDKSFPDSTHTFTVRVVDQAANNQIVHGSIDKDLRGPKPVLVHPLPPFGATQIVFHAHFADSLTGHANDRHGVDSLRLRVVPAAYVFVPGRVGVPDTTMTFSYDVSSQLAAEGIYKLVLQARDTHGVTDSLTFTYDIDRTAPTQPVFRPRPGPDSKVQQIPVVLAVDSTAFDVLRVGGAAPPDSQTVHRGGGGFQVEFQVLLRPGANLLRFTARDLTHNVSLPETTTVVFETSQGMTAPERFAVGNVIQLHAGDAAGRGAEVRIYATDGSLVRSFESSASQIVYNFTWDLQTDHGRRVKNGAYLVQGVVHETSGADTRYRKLIAVLE